MHDIDRILTESGIETEMQGADNMFETDDREGIYGQTGTGSPLTESEEIALAEELLSVTSDAELDQFLGSVFQKVVGGAKKFFSSPIGRTLGGALKGLARKALPIAGGALGGFIGGPIGSRLGSQLASAGGRLFGLELEGLSPEDQEFEIARRFVRLASTAAKDLATSPLAGTPQAAVREALVRAAQQHAPGLLSPSEAAPAASGAHSGRWIRRGRKIVLLGV